MGIDDHIIEWYGPDRGPNSVEDIVSHFPGVEHAVMGMAMGLARDASANLSLHYRRGHAFVEVARHPNRGARTPDWYVYLRDSDPGGEGLAGKNRHDRSAMAIEFGWTTKTGKDVKGLHILGNAMKRAASRYRGR